MRGEVFEICANIDDMTGEDLGAAMKILFDAGALDVWFEHIQMKKNRPAAKLCLLARPGDEERLAEAVLRNTTTLGVRMHRCSRVMLERSFEDVHTLYGDVRIKKGSINGEAIKEMAEFDDVLRIAYESGKPMSSVRAMIAEKRALQSEGVREYIGTARVNGTGEELLIYRSGEGLLTAEQKHSADDKDKEGNKI